MPVSDVQQIGSVIRVQESIAFQILLPFRLLQNIGQSSLCYTVGPFWLSILNMIGVTSSFWLPNAYKSCIDSMIESFKCVIVLCLKKLHRF